MSSHFSSRYRLPATRSRAGTNHRASRSPMMPRGRYIISSTNTSGINTMRHIPSGLSHSNSTVYMVAPRIEPAIEPIPPGIP